MTNIKLHGILAKDFGGEFKLHLDNINTLIDAIECNRSGFLKKLNTLSQMGLNYCLVIDGQTVMDKKSLSSKKPKRIDFVPIVCGQGFVAAAVGIAGLIAGAATAGAIGTALSIAGGIFLSAGLSMLLAPKPEFPDAVAAESTVSALTRSFSFANRANVAVQGVAVPVGYGRLRVGSQVIQGTVKTYPQNVLPLQAMQNNAVRNDNTKSEAPSEASLPQ
jgi:predicted phage tail protein